MNQWWWSLTRFHLLCYTIGFLTQARKLGPVNIATKIVQWENTVEKDSFKWSHRRVLNRPQIRALEVQCTCWVVCDCYTHDAFVLRLFFKTAILLEKFFIFYFYFLFFIFFLCKGFVVFFVQTNISSQFYY